MPNLKAKEALIIGLHALIGWALCGAIIAVGFNVTTIETTLVTHAIGGPIIFGLVSWNYFSRYAYTTPLQTAVIFVAAVILIDFFVVALLMMGSLEMFRSFLGTWLPYCSIFAVTYIVGRLKNSALERRTAY